MSSQAGAGSEEEAVAAVGAALAELAKEDGPPVIVRTATAVVGAQKVRHAASKT